MAHISTLNASVHTSLAYSSYTTRPADTAFTTWNAQFDSDLDGVDEHADFNEVGSIREFPSMGTPANIVNVPVYGQATSSQIQGQSDSPTLEFTVNYIPTQHGSLETLRKAGTKKMWRVRLKATAATITDLDVDEYDDMFFIASIASFEVTPALTDAMQATITLAIDGEFVGPVSSASGVLGVPA
jgi:hypothetical protein